MHFKLTRILHCVLLCSAAMTQSAHSAPIFSDKVTLFEFKPQVCIVKKIGQQCTLTTQLHWRATVPIAACLTQQSQVLHCWPQGQNVSEQMSIALSESTSVWLIDSDQDKLASALLSVNAIHPKKRRRRLRSPWSLF